MTETFSVDPDVVAQAVYDYLQQMHQETALASIEGFAAEMNYSYQLAGTIGESVMRYVLQYDRGIRSDLSLEQAFVQFLSRNCRLNISEAQVAECLGALGWHILAQLSVYRVRPQERVPGY